MICSNCGNNLKGNENVCPYCGMQIINNNYSNNQYGDNAYAIRQGTNSIAIVGFVLAFILPLFGLIFSIIGLVNSKYYYKHNGRGLSIAGIVISLLPLIIFIMIIIGAISISVHIS